MTDTTINVGRDNLGQIAGRDINITYEGDAAYDVRGLENPYLGLAAFTYAERDRYAGREAETQQALTRLTTPGSEQALLFITGASGSGKSSFAQAGLLPALEYHYHQQGFTVKWALFRPGEKPVAALASALRSLHLAADGIFAPAAEYVLAPPLEPPPDNQISILVIDQFEEMFSQSEAAQRKAMFEILAALPLFRQSRLHVIATMRADYLRDLFDDEGLYEIGKDGIDLRAMSEDELKIAIQRPLLSMHATLGKRFQTALLNRLAKDAAEDAAYLPLLQVTLEELWRTGILTADHYESLSHAIRKRAEEVYQHRRTLDGRLVPRGEDEQQMILDSFLDLVDVSLEDDIRRDVRRTRHLAAVTRGRPEAEALVQELATARLLTTDEQELDGSRQAVETVDIIHESLINNWVRLREAIQSRRKELQRRRLFEVRLDEWLDNDKTKERLLSGVQLEEAIELKDLKDVAVQSEDALAFVTQSIQERDRIRNRTQRITQAVAGVLGILLIISAVLTWKNRQISDSLQTTNTSLKERKSELEDSLSREQSALQREEQESEKNRVQAILFDALDTVDSEERLRLALESVNAAQPLESFQPVEAARELLHAVADAPTFSQQVGDINGGAHGLTFDPDGRWLAIQRGSSPGTGQLFDWASKAMVALPPELTGISYFHFVTATNLLIVEAWPYIHVVNKDDLTVQCTLPQQRLYYLAYSEKGKYIVASDEAFLYFWAMENCTKVGQMPFTTSNMDLSNNYIDHNVILLFNEAQTQMYAVSRRNKTVYRWDVSKPEAPDALEPIEADSIVSSNDGAKWLLSVGEEVLLLDISSDTLNSTGLAPEAIGSRGILSPTGRFLWTPILVAPTYALFDVETGVKKATISLEARVKSAGWHSRASKEFLLLRSAQQVRLLDAETGELIPAPPTYRGAEIRLAEIDPSRQWLILELANQRGHSSVEIWDVERNTKVAEYGFATNFWRSITYSPDGQQMVILGRDSTLGTDVLRAWPLPSSLKAHDIFSSAETVLALVDSEEGVVSVIDTADTIENAMPQPVVKLSPATNLQNLPKPSQMEDSLVNYDCSDDGVKCTISVWSFKKDVIKQRYTLICGEEQSGCPKEVDYEQLRISSDGRWLAAPNYLLDTENSDAASDGGNIAVWDSQTDRWLPDLKHDTWISAFTFSPTEPLLATLDDNGVVRLWSLDESGSSPVQVPPLRPIGAPYPVFLKFTADGKRLLNNGFDSSESGIGSLRVIDVDKRELIYHYQPDSRAGRPGVEYFEIAADGNSVYVALQFEIGRIYSSEIQAGAAPGQYLQRWSIEELEPQSERIPIANDGIQDMAFFPTDGAKPEYVAVASSDGLVRIWDAALSTLLVEVPHDVGVRQVAFAPDGRSLVTVDVDNGLHTWPININEGDNFYGLLPRACQALSRDFTDDEWSQFMGDRERGEWVCAPYKEQTVN